MRAKRTIMIELGGWHIAYYMGVFHYIFTTYGVDAFTDVYFTGVSAGGQTCGYCLGTIHGCKDMKYWLDNGPKQAVLTNNYGYGRLALGCYNAGKFIFNKLNKKQKRAITKYFSALCMDCMCQPYICDNIDNAVDFGCAVAATGNVPIVASVDPWKFKGVPLWDGYINTYINKSCYVDTNTTLLFTFKNNGTHARFIDLSKWTTTYSGISSMLPSFYSQNGALDATEKLFQCGYDDAKQNENELLYQLRGIGINL
jgi:hypothetical protein